MPVDWNALDAVGSVASGLGTVGGAILVAVSARLAFKNWKKQRIEERQMEVAERVLTLAYRLEAVAAQIRSPFIFGPEAIAAVGLEEANRSKTGYGGLIRRTPNIAAQVVLHRIAERQTDWDELIALRATILVHFDQEIEKYLGFFLTLRGTLQMLAHELASIRPDEQEERSRFLMQELFAREGGTLDLATAEALSKLKQHLLPKLRTPEV